MEKQSGCMSGFLQIFDRQQILAGKRIHSTKRLPPSTDAGESPETESSGESYEFSRKLERCKHAAVVVPANSDNSQSSNGRLKSPAEKMNCRQKPPMKSYRDIHRLSLDSRITVGNTQVSDGDDNRRRSPSVIARLMGLEPLSMSSSDQKTPETAAKPTLRRSASESRVSGDLIHSKYIDDNNFQVKQPNKSQKENESVKRIVRDDRSNVSNSETANRGACKSMEYASVKLKSESSRTSSWRSRTFFDSTDFFPEPNQRTVTKTMHGGFDKKLNMKGIDEQSNDLSTLKQILEVLQLKGLLSSTSHRNFVYDRNVHFNESNILLVKPWRSSPSKAYYHRSVNDFPASSLNRHGGAVDRSGRTPVRVRTSSPNRIESNLKACNPIRKTKLPSVDSPKLTPKRNRSVHQSSINRSPRSQKPTESSSINPTKQKSIQNIVTEDESSSISESIFSTPSTTDSERSKWERCDKLLYSKTETNSTTESPPSSAIVLPSPVSVLDSGFDKDELLTPSHGFDLKATPAVDFNDDNRSPNLSPAKSTNHEEFTSNDADFIYISHIIRASQHLPEHSNVFFSIEKQLYNTENTPNVSKRQRKLIFDVVLEIIDRNRKFPPWKQSIEDSRALIKQIWSEFQKIREINTGDGVLELVSGVIEKDVVEMNDWRDYQIEKTEVVLDIERMMFKDLVSEAIGDLVEFSGECVFFRTRRKLVF